MACGDVLSLEDLQTAKKHQIFEAEVITGKVGGVAGGATIDTATNPVTGQTQQTLPSILADLGFDVQSWTSSTGGVLASANQVFLNDTPGSLGLGDYYAWGGAFPKTVPAGTDPALPTSGYIMRSSRFAGTQAREALRRSYAEAGYNLVDGSFESGGTLVDANDVLLQERTGKAFSGPAGTVAAGTNPASGGFTDRSQVTSTNATLGEIATGKFGIGSVITIKDRAWAVCDVVSGGTANGIDILDAGSGKTAVIRTSKTLILDKFVNDITGATVVTAAVLRCVALLKAMGGGELIAPAKYLIDAQIDTPSKVTVDGLGAGKIIQRANNVGIICPVDGSTVRNWAYRDITLEYETRQTTNNGTAVKLSKSGTVSYLYDMAGVTIRKAFYGVSCPPVSGSNTFLGTFKNVTVEDPTDWGFAIEGDPAGANTNIRFDQTWVVNTEAVPQPGSKGYLLRRIQDLDCGRMACDHIQGLGLLAETCTGNIGSIALESCDFAGSSGVISGVNISGGALSINNAFFVGNTINISGSASFAFIMFGAGVKLDVKKITESSSSVTDTSSGNVYSAYALTDARFNNSESYTGPVRPRQDTANRSIFTWDGASLRDARGTTTVAAGGFITTGLSGTVKQYTVNIAPVTPEAVPTVRPVVVEATSAGGLKIRYYKISDGTQDFGSYDLSWTAAIN